MADGQINIEVEVDATKAVQGIDKIDQSLGLFQAQIQESGQDFVEFTDDVDANARQLASQLGQPFDKVKQRLVAFREDAGAAGDALETKLKPKAEDTVKGLDSLKGGAGEVSSSFGQFGGAIGVLSPELGGMASQVGALAGGLEGAAKMTKLTGGSMKTLAIGAGALGVVAASLGVAWKVFSSRLNAANERIKESHIAMEEGIASAHAYKVTLMGLQNAVGLLGDAEFARAQAAKAATDATAKEREEQEDIRHSVGGLAKDIEGLIALEAQLVAGEFDHIGKLGVLGIEFRNISKMIEMTGEQLENNEVILSENGITTEFFNSKQIKSGEVLQAVRDEIENTRGSLGMYTKQIEAVDERTERLNLLMQIQSAQAREDSEEVKKLALSLAILEDVETRLHVAALRAAEALAIQSLQMMNLGPATAASITAIRKLFDTMESDAPSGFQTTLAQINTKLKTTASATDDATAATKESIDVQAQLNEQMAAQAEAYANAQSLVALELSDREAIVQAHRDQKAELQSLLADELITYEQYADKLTEIDEQKANDLLANDLAVAQSKIATAEMFNAQLESILDASMDKRAAAIDADEAEALARAEGNAEAQEAIRTKFDDKRKSELGTLFKAQQASQIASAIMSGASAGIGALAPPPTGLGPNAAGLAMMAFVAASTATQVGLIASQQPAFHQGGIVGGQGDQAITAQGGEVVLNREAVAAMGGPSAAAGLNQGGGGGGTIVIQNVYKQRVFDAVIADNLAKGGPLKSALNNATRAGRRGRVGGLL
jgi:hypothetical protein